MSSTFFLSDEALEYLPEWSVPESCGAVVSFWGKVRNQNEGRRVQKLEYSAYDVLAEKEGLRIVNEALERFPIDVVRAVHRLGLLAIGEAAVVVEVASAHRGEAFEACCWVIDEVKRRVPIWKREVYEQGGAEWVMCHHSPTLTDK
ncbi:MAG: molybdenum cofactor biosynthesis protein MoaE [Spirochaetales bacterium]|nr:molybdenum cofactor biosynthesis protein MoaE [Spirochaetales bacterium]